MLALPVPIRSRLRRRVPRETHTLGGRWVAVMYGRDIRPVPRDRLVQRGAGRCGAAVAILTLTCEIPSTGGK